MNRFILSCVLLFTLSACAAKKPSDSPPQVVEQQMAFSSPEQAVEALKSGVFAGKEEDVALIFGPAAQELLHTSDAVADRQAMASFSQALKEEVLIVNYRGRSIAPPAYPAMQLLVGKRHWPFPVLLVRKAGCWQFDTANGVQEIVNRRIGENELNVIKLLQEYVVAQKEYYAQDRDADGTREFARKFVSTPGKKDGLYWNPVEGEALSPFGPMVAAAAHDGYDQSSKRPFHGYHFRILTSQSKNARGGAMNYLHNGKMTGGFALLAYPAQWDVSGAMSFLVGPDGVMYERNLGAKTSSIVTEIKEFDPRLEWNPVRY